MNAPLLSIVIPSAGRPDLLPRAIRSALASGPADGTEVLVVPNGPDQSWKEALRPLQNEPSLRVLPIETAHANVARNHGLLHSRGHYLRFLDDDDYLYPEAASEQLAELDALQCDVSCGRVESIGPDLRQHGLATFPTTSDFVCAAMSVSGFTLLIGNVFRREALRGAIWDPSVPRGQDNVWMMHLAGLHEWQWLRSTRVVGAWFHHGGSRISSNKAPMQRPVWMVSAILELVQTLKREGRLNEARQLAAGNALWQLAHQRFPLDPLYSHALAREALKIHGSSRPADYPLPEGIIDHLVSPVALEWALLPKRYLNHLWRTIRPHKEDHVRIV